jgi:DNA-binding NtrC family response regulator
MNQSDKINITCEHSPFIERLLHTIEPIILSGLGLVIVGEPGTEREYLASRIHELSGRGQNDFSTFDCGFSFYQSLERIIFGSEDLTLTGIEINKGMIESSIPGSIFFENVNYIPSSILNRFIRDFQNGHFRRIGGIEDIPMNIRILAGMNSDSLNKSNPGLNEMLRQLFPLSVNFSPLRERKDDVLYYLDKMLGKQSYSSSGRNVRISDEVMRFILEYSWPGNLREFKNVMKYTISSAGWKTIHFDHLPPYLKHQYKSRQIFSIKYSNEMN